MSPAAQPRRLPGWLSRLAWALVLHEEFGVPFRFFDPQAGAEIRPGDAPGANGK